MSVLRKLLHKYVPSHFHDPAGLLVRIARTRDRAAYFAVMSAVAGVLLSPLDLLLSILEHRLYRNAPKARLPLIIVVGAPRTGTNLPVAYLNNLTAIFPRAPIIANCIFG